MFHESWPQSIFLSLAVVNETYIVEFLAQYCNKSISYSHWFFCSSLSFHCLFAVNLFHSLSFGFFFCFFQSITELLKILPWISLVKIKIWGKIWELLSCITSLEYLMNSTCFLFVNLFLNEVAEIVDSSSMQINYLAIVVILWWFVLLLHHSDSLQQDHGTTWPVCLQARHDKGCPQCTAWCAVKWKG